MNFSDECEKLFGTSDFYEIFNIAKNATEKDVKKAYRQLSLLHHPDKNNEDLSVQKFQAVSKIYSILSNADKRKVYDSCGVTEFDACDFGGLSTLDEWVEYWRAIFPKLTKKKLDEFELEYKNGAEERDDIVKAYKESNGNMSYIMERVFFAGKEDEPRIIEIIQQEIEKKRLKETKKFARSINPSLPEYRKRQRKYKKEASEFKKSGGSQSGGGDGLYALLSKRQQERAKGHDSFLERLVSTYGEGEEEDEGFGLDVSANSSGFEKSSLRKKNSGKRGR